MADGAESTVAHDAVKPVKPYAAWTWPWDMRGRRSKAGVTIVSLDSQWLKLVQAAGPPQARTITTLIAHPVQGVSDDDIFLQFRKLCADRAIAPSDVLIANSSQFTTLRVLNLPSTNPAELEEMAALQAEQHIPYAKAELLKDFHVLGRDAPGYSRVLLAISHQDVVLRAVKLVEGLQWPIARVGCDVEGLLHWFRLMRRESQWPVQQPDATVLLADLDSHVTNLVIMHQEQPCFHRSLAIGVTQLQFDATWGIPKLVEEFQRSLEAFEGEGLNLPVTHVVLTGSVDRVPALAARLQESLNLPTMPWPPLPTAMLSLEAMQATETVPDVSFVSVVGLALGSSTLDLTPANLKMQQAFRARTRQLMTLGYQVVCAVVLLSSLAFARGVKDQQYLQTLTRRTEAVAPQAHSVEQALERLDMVQERMRHRGQLLDALLQVAQLCPAGLRLDAVSYDHDEQLTLRGVSDEMPRVFEFQSALEASAPFAGVETRRVTKRKVEGHDETEFEIVCPFAKARRAPPPTTAAQETAPRKAAP